MERLAGRLGQAAAERQRLARQAVGRAPFVLDDDEDHAMSPRRLKHVDDARRGLRALAEDLDGALLLDRDAEPDHGPARRGRAELDRSISFFLARSRPGTDG